MNFNALPLLISELPGVNFSALSLANNHILDQGKEGVMTTLKLLSELGIKTFGAGKNIDEAWQPQIVEQNGIKIAFIGASYAAYNDNGQGLYEGVARMQDTKKLTIAVQDATKVADFVVVMMHAGAEYTRAPTKLQRDFAQQAIDV
jgi:poly-gamma-glutamate synthesis protein (capsule biosynthesis protein)